MTDFGSILYVLAGIIVLLFWRQVRGLSFDDLLEQGRREHHHVLKVIAKHPHGGTWKEHKKWLREQK